LTVLLRVAGEFPRVTFPLAAAFEADTAAFLASVCFDDGGAGMAYLKNLHSCLSNP
jgi:hypothetical protein